MKFYPSDWRADQTLRICSLAARGLWMEMLCIMHESTKPGLLLINDNPVTETHLGLLTGAPPSQIVELLAELESAGVFSRNRDGVVYSRRMTRDHKRAQTARKNGAKGGNPTLGKQRGIPDWDNPPDKPPDKGGVKAQRPEARGQKESGLGLDRRSLSLGRGPPTDDKPDPEKFAMTMDWSMERDVETRLERKFMPVLGLDGFWRQVRRYLGASLQARHCRYATGVSRGVLENWLERSNANREKIA